MSTLFGTYTSECRKAVLPIVEERQNLLYAIGNYEGLEHSPRIFYAAGVSNQSIVPTIFWCVDALKARRFFVVGSEEVWSRTAAEISKDSIKANGATLAGESYLPMGALEADALVEAIKAAKPDVVISTIVGESNPPFYAGLQKAGLTADKLPVVSHTVSEDELRQIPPAQIAGHFSGWNYFQSVDRPANRDFVRRFKARYGEDRVTSDAVVAAYDSVLIWSQSVNELGSAEPNELLEHFSRQSLNAPDAIVTIDIASHVFWRQFHLGRARSDGQFDVVWSITKPIRPMTQTMTRTTEQWQTFLDGLHNRWGGRWSSALGTRPGSDLSPK